MIPNITKHEFTNSKIEREIFLNEHAIPPKTQRIMNTVSNQAIEFAINSFTHLRHINAFSIKVIKCQTGGEVFSSSFRDASIKHMYDEYTRKCETAGEEKMSKYSFSKIVYIMCKKKSKLLACQDTILAQY